MAFVFPGLVALCSYSARGTTQAVHAVHAERGGWDRALWVLGWVLVAVGLLQAAASITSQFI